MNNYSQSILFLQTINSYLERKLEKLYELYSKYKDTEILKKAILSNLEGHTELQLKVVNMIEQLAGRFTEDTLKQEYRTSVVIEK